MLIKILSLLSDLAQLILLVYCVFSWIIRDPYNKAYAFLSKICDPILKPIRFLLYKIPFLENFPIDLSPLILGFLLRVLLP
ncbi:MAG: YggT family protein [Clostridia bacterium]|nr:YggT family protein [Clostridia bacterium]